MVWRLFTIWPLKIVMKKNNFEIILSPLAGVTDRAFRSICNDYDMDYAYTEMVSAKGLLYLDKNSKELLEKYPGETNIGVQIFGSEPEIMADVIKKIVNNKGLFNSIDINMGCPAPKIVKNGEGSALMKNPELVKKIIYTISEATDLPVSAKFRLGFDENSINYLEIGKICEDYGASKVTLHARTRKQMYSGKADWNAIKQLKESLNIPVVGNGDIFTPQDVVKMVEFTGVDAVAIGRGAMGNPFLFKQIKQYMETGNYDEISLDEIIQTIFKHYHLLLEYKGDRIAINEMRKHIAWYLKGFRGSNNLKNKINVTKSKEDVFDLINTFREEYKLNEQA